MKRFFDMYKTKYGSMSGSRIMEDNELFRAYDKIHANEWLWKSYKFLQRHTSTKWFNKYI